MRSLFTITAIAAIGFAASAAAEPVALTPIAFSPALQADIQEDLGARDGDYLRRMTADALTRALRNVGADVTSSAPMRVEVTIVDAEPNRPTFKQLGQRIGLDYSSISIGGAELNAVVRGADGQVLAQVNHRRFSNSLRDVALGASTWSDARRAISQFAVKVARAVDAQAG